MSADILAACWDLAGTADSALNPECCNVRSRVRYAGILADYVARGGILPAPWQWRELIALVVSH